jgi:hypothetical protein
VLGSCCQWPGTCHRITDDSLEERERGAATGSPIQIPLGREDWVKGDGRPVSEWKGGCEDASYRRFAYLRHSGVLVEVRMCPCLRLDNTPECLTISFRKYTCRQPRGAVHEPDRGQSNPRDFASPEVQCKIFLHLRLQCACTDSNAGPA